MGLVSPAAASADVPANCVQQFWMVGLRAATRSICDSPVRADGSWIRGRSFYAPSFVASGSSICYGYGYCTFTMPHVVAEMDVRDTYIVTPDTVLPDEPPHLGEAVQALA